jgi:anti-sigma factor RsiW
MRSRVVLSLAALALAVVALAVVVQQHRAQRATVPKISALVAEGAVDPPARVRSRRVDGLGFPDFSALGWTVTGGRADVVGGRGTGTAYYRRAGGHATVTYTVLSGTKNLNDANPTWVREHEGPRGKVALNWQSGPGLVEPPSVLVVRFVRRGHPVVLTGRPASEALRREMTDLAAASAFAV